MRTFGMATGLCALLLSFPVRAEPLADNNARGNNYLTPLQSTQPMADLGIPATRQKAPATAKKNYRVRSSLKTQFIAEENTDLGTRDNEFESGIVLNGQVGVTFQPAKHVKSYIQARALENMGISRVRDDNGQEQGSASFVELRQAWVEFNNIFDSPILSTKLGRQRMREEYGLWWNRDIDALRVSLSTESTHGFMAVGQNIDNYRFGEDDAFADDEQDRFRVMGEVSHRITRDHRIEGRILYEYDHSGTQAIGSIVNTHTRDDEDGKLLWFGARLAGTFDKMKTAFGYRLDGIGVMGSEILSGAVSGPGGGERTISAHRHRDVAGWAVDGQLNTTFHQMGGTPTVMLGYAYGSGDDQPAGTGADHAFRQSGMEGNTSRPMDNKTQTNARNYGEVLRPALSNIHIAKVGLHIPLYKYSHMTLTYFNYWLDEKTGGLRASGISAPLTGTNSHLGQALDFSTDYALGKEWDLDNSILRSVTSRFMIGGFKAGDAFGPAVDDYAWRAAAELRVRF